MSLLKRKTKLSPALFSSEKMDYRTPQWLYDELDQDFHFNLDAAASDKNALALAYYTREHDALVRDWYVHGSIFCNPPYGRGIGRWVKKGFDEAMRGSTVVMLLASRTDTKWFHDYVLRAAHSIHFVKGRLTFRDQPAPAPFPSVVVVFKGKDVS